MLIMDEPTSALSAAEVEVLFRVIRDLKARRRRHRLHLAPARGAARDRRPRHRAPRRPARRRVADAADVDVPWIVEKMVGRDPASLFTEAEHERRRGRCCGSRTSRAAPGTAGYAVDHVSLDVARRRDRGPLRADGRRTHRAAGGARRAPSPTPVGDVWLGGRALDGAPSATASSRHRARARGPPDAMASCRRCRSRDNMVLASLGSYVRRFSSCAAAERRRGRRR